RGDAQHPRGRAGGRAGEQRGADDPGQHGRQPGRLDPGRNGRPASRGAAGHWPPPPGRPAPRTVPGGRAGAPLAAGGAGRTALTETVTPPGDTAPMTQLTLIDTPTAWRLDDHTREV